MSALDWLVCVLYLAAVVALAVLSMRGQEDNEDYFLGGRRMSWLAVGVSLFATSFTSVSFLGLPQRGAFQDFSFFLAILTIPLLITPILWFVFVPLYVRLEVSSGYSYLGRRFGPGVQKVGSLLYCAYALGWMAAMLYAIGLALRGLLGLTSAQYVLVIIGLGAFATIYTAMGGLRGVVWTDVLQALTLGGAVVAVLLLAVWSLPGGWRGLWEIGREHGRWTLFHLEPHPLARANFTNPRSLYTAVAFAVFMYLPGYAVAQDMIQRYVCTDSLRSARRTVLLGAAIHTGLGFLFLLAGVAIFAFYAQAGGPGLPSLTRQDQILPHFVAERAPGMGLAGLLLAGLFAATMSTVDSGINGVASTLAYDWLGGRSLSLKSSRDLTVILGSLVVVAALAAPLLGDNVVESVSVVAVALLGALMAVFLLGMFAPRANGPGVLLGLAAGAASLAVVLLKADVPPWWYGAFTVLPTLVVGLAASRLFAPPTAEALAATFSAAPLPRGGRRPS